MSKRSVTRPSQKPVSTRRQARAVDVAERKKWTIMFLLAGDSGISSSMISQLKAITDAGFQQDTNVLVYFDPNCNGMHARIFDVNNARREFFTRKYNKPTVIGDGEDPYVRNIAEDCYRAGLPQIPAAVSLRYFLTFGRTYRPADNYIVFLMGHGVVVGNDAFLPDPNDNSAITLPILGKILKSFRNKVRKDKAQFHLLGLHSCSMNSVEVAYELQGTARYMIGAQGSAFPGSWPYRQMLKKIFVAIERHEHPREDHPEDQDEPADESNGYPTPLVRKILRGLQDLSFYNSVDFWLAGYSSDISMFSLDNDKIKGLDSALKRLALELKAGLGDGTTRDQILRAHLESQSYWNENYTDLYDFCELLTEYARNKPNSPALRESCKNVMEILTSPQLKKGERPRENYGHLVAYSDFFGPAYQHSNGLSVYFPWREPEPQILSMYEQYAFHAQAGKHWLSFLNAYFKKTKRPANGKTYRGLANPNGPIPPVKLTLKQWDEMPDKNLLTFGSAGTLDPGGSEKSGGEMNVTPGEKSGGEMDVTPGEKSGGEMDSAPADKSGGEMDITPGDKSGGEVGIFGRTVIKNFENPKNAVVTSRPKAHPWKRPPVNGNKQPSVAK